MNEVMTANKHPAPANSSYNPHSEPAPAPYNPFDEFTQNDFIQPNYETDFR